jgi:hypothetical protein
VTDLVITALIAAGLFSGAALLAYDMYSTLVWRRQGSPQSQPVQAEPTADSIVRDLPVPAVDALSP